MAWPLNDLQKNYEHGSNLMYYIMKTFLAALLLLVTCTQAFTQKVYSVDYANQADVKVFVVKYENQADLKVYIVKYESKAVENNGKWYFTKYANQAKKKIYFVEYENQADLKIYFIAYESQAGWRNQSLKHLMY
jgi:hypothetical protein